jgi:hypothetical protein
MRLGCQLSPLLFNVVLEFLAEHPFVKRDLIKNTTNANVGKDARKNEPSYTAGLKVR